VYRLERARLPAKVTAALAGLATARPADSAASGGD